ncbi:hypothetical protein HDU91_004607, partial [Kappamyces sp. JEL0680]
MHSLLRSWGYHLESRAEPRVHTQFAKAWLWLMCARGAGTDKLFQSDASCPALDLLYERYNGGLEQQTVSLCQDVDAVLHSFLEASANCDEQWSSLV